MLYATIFNIGHHRQVYSFILFTQTQYESACLMSSFCASSSRSSTTVAATGCLLLDLIGLAASYG